MGRWWSCLGAIAALLAALFGSGKAPKVYPTGCSTTSYTADGGYFDQGQFFSLSSGATITVHWCYAKDVITSHSETYSTDVPERLQPRFSTDATLSQDGTVLDVELTGGWMAGIINNVARLIISGEATATGDHHFANDSDT